MASIASASPAVLKSHVPIASSFVRIDRIASSSSRAISEGPPRGAGRFDARDVATAAARAARDTVNVAVRDARSMATSTCW